MLQAASVVSDSRLAQLEAQLRIVQEQLANRPPPQQQQGRKQGQAQQQGQGGKAGQEGDGAAGSGGSGSAEEKGKEGLAEAEGKTGQKQGGGKERSGVLLAQQNAVKGPEASGKEGAEGAAAGGEGKSGSGDREVPQWDQLMQALSACESELEEVRKGCGGEGVGGVQEARDGRGRWQITISLLDPHTSLSNPPAAPVLVWVWFTI